ncbi:MAG TPA: 1,4-alpha-glucan-branching enzyme [Bacteroidales bacterium]|nr:1,4-alpha-glucan-branching enzyme [Bacteroidales bacterium]
MKPRFFATTDEYLSPFSGKIIHRINHALAKEQELTQGKTLYDFANGHLYYGLHRTESTWVVREWAPNVEEMYLIGDFSDWKPLERFRFNRLDGGNWELLVVGDDILTHGSLYKLFIVYAGGYGERIPAWARRVVQDETNHVWSAQVWKPARSYNWKNPPPSGTSEAPLIYEAHAGMATEEYKVGTWEEFRVSVLPYIHKAGYNTIQLMAIQEHPYYGSFGYHVSSFFAASSRFGTPEELKALIDDAHGLGIRVIMDLVHSHAVKNEVEGISRYDGTLYQFFHDGERGNHQAWDSRCFDYGKNEVLHFLLSNCKFWLEEYGFDGFRFDGVTSMLYRDHGLGINFMDYGQYFNENQDEDAIAYLYLANKLIGEVNPHALSIAEEMSGYPGLALPQKEGGIGFSHRLAMGLPDYWIRTIREQRVQFWHVGEMFYQLTNKRADEKTVHYAESHDQALVGDKTLIFWLIDQEMYWHMRIDHNNLVVSNGLALHKMIRLITLATAGNGYLNFMGNEFGHPEWIDFPRADNNWSYHHARRQWSLLMDENLNYCMLGNFDREMVGLVNKTRLLSFASVNKVAEHIDSQIIVFERGGFIFAFNFNPFESTEDFEIEVPKGKYRILLTTDSLHFGGFARIDTQMLYPTSMIEGKETLKLYLPALCGIVLQKIKL